MEISDNQSYSIRVPFFRLGFILSLIAAMGTLWATRLGAGVSSDSVLFLQIASNIASGDGFSVWTADGACGPIVHKPPLFPFLLATFDWAGVDPWTGARWMNALLFGANLLLIGGLIRLRSRTSFPGWAAMAIVLVSPGMWAIHGMVWSEPLFFLLGLAGLHYLSQYLERGNAPHLVFSGLFVGAATMERFPGLAFVATGAMAILLWGKGARFRARLAPASLFAFIATAPFFFWILRTVWIDLPNPAKRPAFHPVSLNHLKSLISTVTRWFFPENWPAIPRVVLFIILLGVGLGIWRALGKTLLGERPQPDRAALIFVRNLELLIGFYLLLLLVSVSFLDFKIAFNFRLLSPIYLAGLMVCVLRFSHRWRISQPNFRLRMIAVIIALTLLGSIAARSAIWIVGAHSDGLRLASLQWRQSPTLKSLRALSPKSPVYSNAPDAIYFHLGRYTHGLPTATFSESRLPNPEYEGSMEKIRRDLIDSDGVIALFFSEPWRHSPQFENALTRRWPQLLLLERNEDGAIYAFNAKSE